MRMLSIHAPWATLIALGIKDVENRGKPISYRGPLAIHATKYGPTDGIALELLRDLCNRGMITMQQGADVAARMSTDREHVIAVVELKDCISVKDSLSPWAHTHGFAYVLQDVRLVDPPFKATGGQGLRVLPPPDVEELLERTAVIALGAADLSGEELVLMRNVARNVRANLPGVMVGMHYREETGRALVERRLLKMEPAKWPEGVTTMVFRPTRAGMRWIAETPEMRP